MAYKENVDWERGVSGRRNPDGSKYRAKRFHIAQKPPPKDFREQFLDLGYEAQYYYQCRWPVFRRWIDESGGGELLKARREVVRTRGVRPGSVPRHVKGWSAERIDALHKGQD